jgi:hypothetical protein
MHSPGNFNTSGRPRKQLLKSLENTGLKRSVMLIFMQILDTAYNSCACLMEPGKLSVSTQLEYKMDDWGISVKFQQGQRFFCSPQHPDWFWGLLSFLSNWFSAAISSGVKKLGHEVDH